MSFQMVGRRRADLWDCAFLLLAGVLLYSHTLHVPWYLDDFAAIVEEPLVHDLEAVWRSIGARRWVATLSFALNYHWGGLEVAGYHLVNVSIHLAASCLVFLLLKRVLPDRRAMVLLGALLFLAHPLQTQAVTYMVQRTTSLCGLFSLLSLYLFVRAREELAAGAAFRAPAHLVFYLGAILAGVLALFTKEVALVLPVTLVLFTRFFLTEGDRRWHGLLLYVTPFLLAPVLLALATVALPLARGETLLGLAQTEALLGTVDISPLHYLFTQFSVLWIYVRLLFLPLGQALDYNYPVATSLFTLKNLAGLAGMVALGCLAYRLRQRKPLIACGIAWFFLNLAVESSIIPLDPLFEHRLYLPVLGFVMVVLGLVESLPNRLATTTLCLVLIPMAFLTWKRNLLWQNPVAFYEQNLKQSPGSGIVKVNLAVAYLQMGRIDEAEELLKDAMHRSPNYYSIYPNLASIYVEKKLDEEALQVVESGLTRFPDSPHLLNILAGIYLNNNQADRAIQILRRIAEIDPNYALAFANTGRIYSEHGQWIEAEKYFLKAIEKNSTEATFHHDLGVVLHEQGRIRESREAFLRASQLAPEDSEALFNAAVASLELNDLAAASEMAVRLKELDPAAAAKLERDLARVGR